MPDIPQIIDSDSNDGEVASQLAYFFEPDEHPIGYQLYAQPIEGEGSGTALSEITKGQGFPLGDGAIN